MSKIEIIPNLCTATNLLFGVAAIAAVMNQNYQLSVILIIVASVLDRADGILARRYNAVSAFGKEFDSLADLVSFGVAPSALAYSVLLGKWGGYAGMLCFAVFTLSGAFRLARFNIGSNNASFQGLPITVAGALMAIVVAFTTSPAIVVPSAVLLSLAMISTVQIPKI